MINKRVVIIGAGASGLTAASKLLAKGFKNVIILEAEQRIGGRIYTVPFAANVIDIGAQWCHGENENAVYSLGKEYNSFSSNTARNDRLLLIQSSGDCVNQSIADELMKIALQILDSKDLVNFHGSVGEFMTERYYEATQKANIEPILANEFLAFFEKFQASFDAYNTWFDVSCKQYTEYKTCDGDLLLNWKDRGYKTLFNLIQKKILNTSDCLTDHIQLDKEVCRIKYEMHSGANSKIEIECTDRSVYEADHIICTIPLGVLKAQHSSLFHPSLPSNQINAIEALGFEATAKIFLEFNTPFWNGDWNGFGLLWNDDNRNRLCEQTGFYWLSGIFRFQTVDYQPNVLCARVSGRETIKIESLPDNVLKDGLRILLKHFITNWPISQPVHVITSKWRSNCHFNGSYTHYSMKSEEFDANTKDLARPILNHVACPIIQFAGEATHAYYFSTVHGAIETGVREAQRLIDFYKSTKLDIKSTIGLKPNSNCLDINRPYQISEMNTKHVDIIILGAGLAGLGFATALNQSTNRKCSYLILEGQTRAGGRIHTLDLQNYMGYDQNQISTSINDDGNEQQFIDAGAQWLHGKYNYLHDLSEKHNLLSAMQSEEGQGLYLQSNGNNIDEYFVKKIDFIIGQILEECEEFARNDNDSTNESYPKSVEHFLRERFQEFIVTLNSDDEKLLARRLFDWHLRFQIIDNSCLTLSHVSAKYWGTYSFNGEPCQAHYNFRNGFGDAIQNLVNELEPNAILFKKEIIEITVFPADDRNEDAADDANGIFDADADAGKTNSDQFDVDTVADVNNKKLVKLRPRVSVKCSDGSIYKANHVLVTFSLGVLKQCYRSMFIPRLPYCFEQAISDIGFQTINKLFIQFHDAWWGNVNGIQLVFDETDGVDDDDGSDGGDSSDNSNGDNIDIVKNAKRHWTRWISGFDVMKPGPSNTLLGWVGGQGAIDMESLTDDQIIADCIVLLSKFTKTIVPPPIKYYCTRWHSNGFIKGAYSYISTDCDKNATTSSILTEALYQKDFVANISTTINCGKSKILDVMKYDDEQCKNHCNAINRMHSPKRKTHEKDIIGKSPVMLFAGEACHDKYFSTAHGAFLSGMEQAQKILHYY